MECQEPYSIRILIKKVLSFLGDGRISREQIKFRLWFNGILGTSDKS